MSSARPPLGGTGRPDSRGTPDAVAPSRAAAHGGRVHRIGSALVALQFALIGVVLLPVGPAADKGAWSALGWALIVLGALVGGLALVAMGRDARVHPVPGESIRLRTTGIYAWIRHPMYLAVLLCCAGVVVGSGRLLALMGWLALALVLHLKARFEDELLSRRFGWEFAVYASRVPALIPAPWRALRR